MNSRLGLSLSCDPGSFLFYHEILALPLSRDLLAPRGREAGPPPALAQHPPCSGHKLELRLLCHENYPAWGLLPPIPSRGARGRPGGACWEAIPRHIPDLCTEVCSCSHSGHGEEATSSSVGGVRALRGGSGSKGRVRCHG